MPLGGSRKRSRKRSSPRRKRSTRRKSHGRKSSTLIALNRQAPRGMGVTTKSEILNLFQPYKPIGSLDRYISAESPFSPHMWDSSLYKKYSHLGAPELTDPLLNPLLRKTQDIVHATAYEVIPSQKGGYFMLPSLSTPDMPVLVDLLQSSKPYKSAEQKKQEWLDKHAYQMELDGKTPEEKKKLLNQKYYVANDNLGIDKDLLTLSGTRPQTQYY